MTDKHFVIADLGGSAFLAGLAISLTVGLLSGSYPALYLSSFSPLAALRGTFRQRPSAAALRKGLVVFQFCLSVLLIAATVAVYLQIDYIRNRDLGLDRANVIKLTQEGALKSQYDAVRQELLQRPGIAGVTAASTSPLSVSNSTSEATWDGKDPDAEYEVAILSADYDFIETMKMELVAGRSFSREYGAANPGYVINEKLARIIGSNDVSGTRISFWGQTGPVIGVVKDFEMNSIYTPTEPLIMQLAPQNTNRFFVRTRPGQTGEALASLEEVFEQFNPEYPFDYRFLDEEFESAYRSEVVIGRLANVFAGIAIFISCLGLFGLVSYTVQHRTKEIGVRKVLGATTTNLAMLLSGEVMRLVLLGIALALPISYFIVREWLTRFTDYIDIGFGLFVAAGLLAMVIAWTTVSFQAIKAALADPVKSLRYE
jgi:ABC-type antimicrobial peptide transport system permease subunit